MNIFSAVNAVPTHKFKHHKSPTMNRNSLNEIRPAAILLASILFMSAFAFAQSDEKKKELVSDASAAKAEFLKLDPKMSGAFSSAYGYVIFPNVGKGAIGIGGAAGNGVAYERGAQIGYAKMSQVNFGFQWGGQAYREVIFFEAKKDLDRFKENRVELTAQASAVAAATGASLNAKYVNGVMVFTMLKGGLMYEAAVGGQKFKFSK